MYLLYVMTALVRLRSALVRMHPGWLITRCLEVNDLTLALERVH